MTAAIGDSIAQSSARRGMRVDVEGLRAVAVGLVVVYHAGIPWVPGGFVGVDVFFVISGFLITGLLVRELRTSGRVSLSNFYARRAKRLLPAAAVVLVVTALLVLFGLPRTSWWTVGMDIAAAAAYVVNWRFAQQAVDYLAEGQAASPVQHFWSLAVEEQFYLIWPLLILVAAYVARRRRVRILPALGFGLALVAIPSFLYSVTMTAKSPEWAFFVTPTRLWELAVGAAIAISAQQFQRLSRPAAASLGWLGLAAVVASAFIFSSDSPWPGSGALLPTLGTAAVIAAGPSAGRAGPAAVLGIRPMVWIGGLSYSLYLWHWPLIVVGDELLDGLRIREGVLIGVLSIVPAWLTHKLVENPIRFSSTVSRSPRLALSLGLNFSLVGAVTGLAVAIAATTGTTGVTSAGSALPSGVGVQGALILGPGFKDAQKGAPTDEATVITPDPAFAPQDVPDAYMQGCQVNIESAEPIGCEYGDPRGTTTVALAGDSKMLQWLPALQDIAVRHHWRLLIYTKSGCSFSDAEIVLKTGTYDECVEWNRAVMKRMQQQPPDFVLTSQGRGDARPVGSTERTSLEGMVAGLRSRWQELEDRGVQVIVMLDNPYVTRTESVYECVAENDKKLQKCAFPREKAMNISSRRAQSTAAKSLDRVDVIDMADGACPTDSCAPVIGNVLVYRQGSHLTATYVRTMAPELEARLAPLID